MGTCCIPSMPKSNKAKSTKAKPTGPWNKTKAAAQGAGKKATRYYPAEDVKGKLGNHHNTSKTTKLRKSIAPGQVLILLAGHFKGSRVVFLKQLESGLLLVTGPYKVNGVPLKRVPQSYVIATKTSVNVSGVKVPDSVNDAFFTKPKATKKKDDELFFEKNKEKTLDESRKSTQAAVDKAIEGAISKDAMLKAYLKAKFSLSKGEKPHLMSF